MTKLSLIGVLALAILSQQGNASVYNVDGHLMTRKNAVKYAARHADAKVYRVTSQTMRDSTKARIEALNHSRSTNKGTSYVSK